MNENGKVVVLPLSIRISQTATFTVLSLITFLVPFLVGGPQLLVGTIVNAGLFASAILLKNNYFLPLVFFPSLAALSRGLIFGPFTWYLVFFIPFIWAGNLVLVKTFQKTHQRFGYIGGVLTASLFKQAVLYLAAWVYFQLHIVPALFFQTMGIYQLITALAGGLIAYFVFKTQSSRF